MKKAIILDRDGTLNIDTNYVHKISDFQFISGALEGLRILQDNGYLLIIATNQSGIARGYFTLEDFWNLNTWMLHFLQKERITIRKVYMCPHHPQGAVKKYTKQCRCRKPGLEMFEQAIKEFDIDISNSYVIGDRIRDLSICLKTDMKGILLSDTLVNDYTCKSSLLEAANMITGRCIGMS